METITKMLDWLLFSERTCYIVVLGAVISNAIVIATNNSWAIYACAAALAAFAGVTLVVGTYILGCRILGPAFARVSGTDVVRISARQKRNPALVTTS